MDILNKERFVEYINFIYDRKKFEDKINEIVNQESELICDLYLYSKYESKLVNLLQFIMSDESEWISYFLYDLDFGKKWKPGMITDEDGSDIKLQTPEDLYEILINNLKNI